jgi:hypothetical protein
MRQVFTNRVMCPAGSSTGGVEPAARTQITREENDSFKSIEDLREARCDDGLDWSACRLHLEVQPMFSGHANADCERGVPAAGVWRHRRSPIPGERERHHAAVTFALCMGKRLVRTSQKLGKRLVSHDEAEPRCVTG